MLRVTALLRLNVDLSISQLTSLCSAFYGCCKLDTARICCWALSLTIDRCLLPMGRGRLAANAPHAVAAVERCNRQIDGWIRGMNRSDSYTPLRVLWGSVNTKLSHWNRIMASLTLPKMYLQPRRDSMSSTKVGYSDCLLWVALSCFTFPPQGCLSARRSSH